MISSALQAERSWYQSESANEFCERFQEVARRSIPDVVNEVVEPSAPRAVFLTGSVPLGMGTNGSDVDLIVLVDSKECLTQVRHRPRGEAEQKMSYSSESDPLRARLFIAVINGITVEIAAVLVSGIERVHARLRSPGPDLDENEVMVLGRLGTGWLLTESAEYLARSGISLSDKNLHVYCSVKRWIFALAYRYKSLKALALADIPQALHLGRLSMESAYLAYFASEAFPYLGAKWLAQIGHARGARERTERHPLLKEGVPLLFPAFLTEASAVEAYLGSVTSFLTAMRSLIEQKTLFRIAYQACPQIYSL